MNSSPLRTFITYDVILMILSTILDFIMLINQCNKSISILD